MKRIIKIAVALLFFTCGFVGTAEGQVYSEYLYYHQVDGNKMPIIKFNGSTAVFKCLNESHGISENSLKSYLKKNPNMFETEFSGEYKMIENASVFQRIYEYCPEKTTSQRVVYVCKKQQGVMRGPNVSRETSCYYIAVSKDLSSIITWSENNCDGNVQAKIYSTKVEKKDYIPASESYDFLNE